MDGPARVEGVEWAAVTVDRAAGHRVEPLSALVAAGTGAGSLGPADLLARHARVAEVVAGEAPERISRPQPTGPPPVVVPRSPAGA